LNSTSIYTITSRAILNFKPLAARPSLSALVYETIKQSILSLELQPGSVLSIGDLAEQFEVSRTPVRDALLLLEKDELVTLIPHKGARVTEITPKDVKEMYELHIALECYAIRMVAPTLTAQEFDKLDQILQASRQALDKQEYLLASDLGRKFHDAFVQKLANRRLTAYLQELDILYTRVRHYSALMPGRLEKSYAQHLTILQALKEGETERAVQAMAEHFISISNDMLKDSHVRGLEELLSEAMAVE
jgi:DNA-binding GntR family transcriptional regulator